MIPCARFGKKGTLVFSWIKESFQLPSPSSSSCYLQSTTACRTFLLCSSVYLLFHTARFMYHDKDRERERETHCCERRVTTGTPRKMAHWIQQTDGGKEEEVVPTADTFWLLPLSFLPCALTRAHLLRHKLRHGPMGGVGGVGGG